MKKLNIEWLMGYYHLRISNQGYWLTNDWYERHWDYFLTLICDTKKERPTTKSESLQM